MSNTSEPTVADLYRAFAGLMNTAPGHSAERNQAIAHAELVQNLIETSTQWKAVVEGGESDVEIKARRFDRLVTMVESGDGLPYRVKDCLDGFGGNLGEVIDSEADTPKNLA